MTKSENYQDLAKSLALRSNCNIKVGAFFLDNAGIFSWGWNHAGNNGMGECAEIYAIKRANRRRLVDSTIIVLAIRRGKFICSFPCPRCYKRLVAAKVRFVICHNQDREWMRYRL